MGDQERPVLFERFAYRRLTWWPEIGVGYYPVAEGVSPYDDAYFDRFAAQADSDIGRELMQARVALVARHWKGSLIDVGIGSGAFIALRSERKPTFGWDVSPKAKSWLKERDLLINPYDDRVDAISLWDVMEHIPDFHVLLANVGRWVFISIPIFTDCAHVLRSKHYRKDEHVWYFTAPGLIAVMESLGFDLAERNTIETTIGREDIGSFAFRRR